MSWGDQENPFEASNRQLMAELQEALSRAEAERDEAVGLLHKADGALADNWTDEDKGSAAREIHEYLARIAERARGSW